MSKHTLLGIIAGVMLLCNIFLLAHCWNKAHKGGANEGPRLAIIEKLHFDYSQTIAYDQLIQKHRAAIHEEDLKIRELKSILYQSLADTNKQDSMILLILTEQTKIEHINLAHFNDIRALCNVEQKILFQNMTNELGTLFSTRRHSPQP
jgi:protein CpxP